MTVREVLENQCWDLNGIPCVEIDLIAPKIEAALRESALKIADHWNLPMSDVEEFLDECVTAGIESLEKD